MYLQFSGGIDMEEKIRMEQLEELCRKDSWYQQCLRKAEQLEPAFEQLRSSLDEGQREILDQYLMACEELDHARLLLAIRKV